MLKMPIQINSTSTKTILRVYRYVEQQVNLTIEILKKNYLNDNTKKDYTNNHMTSKIIQCTGKNKESVNILVVNRSMRE